MKALVWLGCGDISLEEVEDPRIEAPTDAIVRLTTTAIGGTDLQMVRGSMAAISPGTILGREGVGVVERVGGGVRNLVSGDRVVIPSTIACGQCPYCRRGFTAQCDRADPRAKTAAPMLLTGLQAERARVPFASFNLVKVPPGIGDGQAILISDAFPAGYHGAEMADIEEGNSVAVLGCGPVGLFAIASAKLMGAGRILAVDTIPERLAQARRLGAEIIDFEAEDPVEAVMELTGGGGVERTIEAVGVDAHLPGRGAVEKIGNGEASSRGDDRKRPAGAAAMELSRPATAPSLTLRWCVEMLAKQGVASVVGGFPRAMDSFPIGMALARNITVRGGLAHHRMIIPRLMELVVSGRIDPLEVVAPTVKVGFCTLEDAFRHFDGRGRPRGGAALPG